MLVQQNLVSLDDVGRCLALQRGVPHADLRVVCERAAAAYQRIGERLKLCVPRAS